MDGFGKVGGVRLGRLSGFGVVKNGGGTKGSAMLRTVFVFCSHLNPSFLLGRCD